jgi:hypothetical protein
MQEHSYTQSKDIIEEDKQHEDRLEKNQLDEERSQWNESMSDWKVRQCIKLTPIRNVKIIKFNHLHPKHNTFINGVTTKYTKPGIQLRPIMPLDTKHYEQVEWLREERYITDLEKGSERMDFLLLPYAGRVIFQRSFYRDVPPTVFFQYPKCCACKRPSERTFAMTQKELGGNFLSFTISETTYVFKCLCKVLKYAGFRIARSSHWNLLWTGANRGDVISPLDILQKTNHFPGIFQIGRKDNLCRNINRLKRMHGREYNICPTTYTLPEDLQRFTKDRESKEAANWIWIMKPCASSCGRGIKLIGPNTVINTTE